MTVLEAAELLGVTGARVRQFIKSGDLKAVRLGAFMYDVNTTSLKALAVRREKKAFEILERKAKRFNSRKES